MSDLSYVRNNDGTYSKLVQLSGSITETFSDTQISIDPGMTATVTQLSNVKDAEFLLGVVHNVSGSVSNVKIAVKFSNTTDFGVTKMTGNYDDTALNFTSKDYTRYMMQFKPILASNMLVQAINGDVSTARQISGWTLRRRGK